MGGNIPNYNSSTVQAQMQTPVQPGSMQPVDLSGLVEFSNTVLAKQKKINDSTWVMKQSALAQQSALEMFNTAKNNMGEDPTGFAHSYLEALDNHNNKLLSMAPSAEAAAMLEQELTQQKTSGFADAFNYEIGVQNEKRKRDFNDALELNKNTLLHQPQKFQQIYEQTFTNPFWEALPAPQRASVEASVKEGLAVAALTGQLNQIDGIKDLDSRLANFEALKKKIDQGDFDQYLSADTQAKVIGGTANDIKAVIRDIDARKKEAVSQEWQFIQSSLDDHEQSLIQTGIPVISRERIATIAKEMDNPLILREYDEMTRNAKGLHSVMASLDISDPQAASRKIESLKPAAGDPQYNSKFKTYEQAKSFYDSNIKAIITDPASYASTKNSVRQAYQRSEQDGVMATLATQSKFGLPSYAQRILTKEQASGMVKQINSLPPDQIEKYFSDMKQKYNFSIGGGITAYDKIFQELHSLPAANRLSGNYSVLASVIGTPVANDLIKAIKQGPELKSALPSGVSYDKVLGAVKGNLSGFAKSFSVGDSSSADLSNVYSATTNLAMQYLNSGKAGSYTEAAKMASKKLILDNYAVIPSPKNNRFMYYIPKSINGVPMDPDKIQSYLKTKQNTKELSNFIGGHYFGDVLKTQPKQGETKQLTYYADSYMSSLNKKLGTNWQVTSRVRPYNGRYSSKHETGEALDVGRRGKTEQQSIAFVRNEVNNPLVKSIGTSDKRILQEFAGNPKVKFVDPAKYGDHTDHFHITMNTNYGSQNFGQYANTKDQFSDTINSVVNTGFWRTNPTGTGAYLMYQNPKTGNFSKVYNAKGQLYEFNFRNISRGM